MEHGKLYQDSNSAILMENNGIASSSKLTKHIKARFFNKGSYLSMICGSWFFYHGGNVG